MTPHDHLFKFAFSDPARAMAEVRSVLPEHVARELDFPGARLVPGSFVDQALQGRHSDLLFEVPLRRAGSAFIYLLFEHQSESDPLMALRLLGYLLRIWERVRRHEPGARRLPLVLSLVLSLDVNGWTAPRRLEALYDAPPELLAAIGDYAPRLEYLVDDLTAHSDEALRGRVLDALAKLVLLLLKHARTDAELELKIIDWLDLFRAVQHAPAGSEALLALLNYAFRVSAAVNPERLVELLHAAGESELKEVVVTAYDRAFEKGREEGRQEGVVEGEQRILLQLLHLRFGPPATWVVERVKSGASGELALWSARVLTAADVEGVFAPE